MAHKEIQKLGRSNQAIAPQAVAGVVTSAYLEMKLAHGALAIIEEGAHTTDVVVKVRQAKNAAGLDVKDITGKTVTLTVALANTQHLIEVEASELDLANEFTHICVATTVAAGAGALMSATLIRYPVRYSPPADYLGA